MSARSSQASAVSISASSERVCELCGSASRTPSASESSQSTGPESRVIPTCAPWWPTPVAKDDGKTVMVKALNQRECVPVPVPRVDLLCGGFPCQDISLAGRGGGIAGGERSGLWREFARLIGELRPRYVVVENVPALTSRGLDIVLADLAACGFDSKSDRLPASAFGAPHRPRPALACTLPNGQGEPDGSVDARSGTRLMGDTQSDGRRSG